MNNFMNGQLSLLPEPPFAPKWPSKHSLPDEVLTRMLAGERVNQITFGLNRWRLAAYIMELRYFGWPVQCIYVPRPAGHGPGRPIREYWLPPEIIAAVKAVRP